MLLPAVPPTDRIVTRATDLEAARSLATAGVPLFMAPPDPSHRTGYRLPSNWERSTADPSVVDQLPDGWALCAVMGHGLDLVDLDPRGRNGVPLPDLPPALATAETPSGGQHLFVLSLGLPSLDGVVPGLDYKGGMPAGQGRGFAFIAPTVRVAKAGPNVGLPVPYRWVGHVPNGVLARTLRQTVPSGRADGLRAAIEAKRSARASEAPRQIARSSAHREWLAAVAKLESDVRHWRAHGWGGEAHAGLLAASTHLARLSSEHAEAAYVAAFERAGVEPDGADLQKIESAVEHAVPDVVVPDEELSSSDRFFMGGGDPNPQPGPVGSAPDGAPRDPIGRVEAGPFQFLDEEQAALIPMPDPLIEGVLFRGTKARLFGESTRGKTWVAMDQAACVANGIPWLGRFEVKQGPVLFVAAEGAPSFAPRMRTWGLANGRKCLVKFWPEPVMIGGPHWDAFVQACEREGFVLIVQDTQAAMTVGRSEDSNDDAGIVQDAWTQLVHLPTAPCSYSIHHTGWAEQGRPRGASAMFAGMDTELRLAEGRHGLVLVTEKQRYSEKLNPIGFRLVNEHNGLVVRPPDGADHLFGDDHDVKVSALVAKVTAHVATGGSVGKAGYRVMHLLLNKELRGSRDEPVSEAVAQDVARAYRRSIGTVV